MQELNAYAGDYVDPGYGTVSVQLEGGELHIALAAFKGVLSHYRLDSFFTVL